MLLFPSEQIIRSRANPRFRNFLRLVKNARVRKEQQLTVLEGIHLVQTYCTQCRMPSALVLSETGSRHAEIMRFLLENPLEESNLMVLTDALFAELSELPSPVGLLGIIPIDYNKLPAQCAPLVLLMDGVQDPGNVGTLLRTAAAVGVQQVFLSKETAQVWSPKVLRSAQGAHFYLELFPDSDLKTSIHNFRQTYKDGRVVALVAHDGQLLYQTNLRGPCVVVLGSEGEGISPALLEAADVKVTIPMPGGFESLNVAIAGAVCLFERLRQQL